MMEFQLRRFNSLLLPVTVATRLIGNMVNWRSPRLHSRSQRNGSEISSGSLPRQSLGGKIVAVSAEGDPRLTINKILNPFVKFTVDMKRVRGNTDPQSFYSRN